MRENHERSESRQGPHTLEAGARYSFSGTRPHRAEANGRERQTRCSIIRFYIRAHANRTRASHKSVT
jgi:hypothetical protein